MKEQQAAIRSTGGAPDSVADDPPHPPAPGLLPDMASGPSWPAVIKRLMRRRHFVVDARQQLRAALLASSVAGALLVLLNLSLHSARTARTGLLAAEVPELAPVLRAQDRAELALVALASLIVLGGVFAITILETHRTAGAALGLRRRIEAVRDGRYDVRLRLRRGDTLRALEEPFNAMTAALQDRAWSEADALDALAEEAGRVATPVEAGDLARRLRGLADLRRRRAG